MSSCTAGAFPQNPAGRCSGEVCVCTTMLYMAAGILWGKERVTSKDFTHLCSPSIALSLSCPKQAHPAAPWLYVPAGRRWQS